MELRRKRNCLRFFVKPGMKRSSGEPVELNEDWILDLLEGYGRIGKKDVLCMQEIRSRNAFDVTLKSEEKCFCFLQEWLETESKYIHVNASCLPKPVKIVVDMDDPFVRTEEILSFLKSKCVAVRFLKDYVNKVGVWNGKRSFLLWLKENENVSLGKISIDGKSGFCYEEKGKKVHEVEHVEEEKCVRRTCGKLQEDTVKKVKIDGVAERGPVSCKVPKVAKMKAKVALQSTRRVEVMQRKVSGIEVMEERIDLKEDYARIRNVFQEIDMENMEEYIDCDDRKKKVKMKDCK